jgi:hypothetical protein
LVAGYGKLAEVQKGFVDTVDFYAGCDAGEQVGNTFADITVQFKIGAKSYDSVLSKHVTEFEEWRSHRYTEIFGLLASRYGAAVVAAQYDNRTIFEFRPEESFAADKEVIAIDECVDGAHHSYSVGSLPGMAVLMRSCHKMHVGGGVL